MPDIKLLDCTLRDGGYVNSWNWGFVCSQRYYRLADPCRD